MTGLLMTFGIFLAAGLFFVTADVVGLPTMSAARAMLQTTRQEKKATKTLETYFMTIAVRLAPFLHLDEYKHSRMEKVLKAYGHGCAAGDVIALMDTPPLHSGKDGYLLSKGALYGKG